MLYIFCIIFVKWFLILLHRPKVYGNKKNLKLKGGVIFIANHQSLLDPVMLVLISPRLIHFMAKKELFDTKIGAAFFKSLLVFPVSRKQADLKSLKQAMQLIEEGKAFGIFPEGRRDVTEELDDFEKGAAFVAAKCSAPIVPIYISPSSYKRTRKLRVNVGECIYVDDVKAKLGGRKLVDALTDRMQSDMEKLKADIEMRLTKK